MSRFCENCPQLVQRVADLRAERDALKAERNEALSWNSKLADQLAEQRARADRAEAVEKDWRESTCELCDTTTLGQIADVPADDEPTKIRHYWVCGDCREKCFERADRAEAELKEAHAQEARRADLAMHALKEVERQAGSLRATLENVKSQCVEGFIACDRCGHEIPMADLDMVFDINSAFAPSAAEFVPEVAPARETANSDQTQASAESGRVLLTRDQVAQIREALTALAEANANAIQAMNEVAEPKCHDCGGAEEHDDLCSIWGLIKLDNIADPALALLDGLGALPLSEQFDSLPANREQERQQPGSERKAAHLGNLGVGGEPVNESTSDADQNRQVGEHVHEAEPTPKGGREP